MRPDSELAPVLVPVLGAPRLRATLISTYDLGRQPFSLGSAAAWLEHAGCEVALADLAVRRLDEATVRTADLIGLYLPMHTATRLAMSAIGRLRGLNPTAHLCAFGLYAPMNESHLRSLGVDSIIGGEFEGALVRLAARLASAEPERPGSAEPSIVLSKQAFRRPERRKLPPLSDYASLMVPDGGRKRVGSTEATRGCKHRCRHCPIVPVYDGRFFVVQRDVVMQDIRQQVEAGAEHIAFGDPDFFNGVGHATALVEQLHREFPALTYDVTIKIEHLLKHADALPVLCRTGCLFVTSAVESVDDGILGQLAKGHTRHDFLRAVDTCRAVGLDLSPTFVAFSPWSTLAGYRDLLQVIDDLDLVENVAPVQLAIRLLIPSGSRLLELEDIRRMVLPYDQAALCYPWAHPDPRVDALQAGIEAIVQAAPAERGRAAVFDQVWARAHAAIGGASADLGRSARDGRSVRPIPHLSEPWYCCAEPTARQRDAF